MQGGDDDILKKRDEIGTPVYGPSENAGHNTKNDSSVHELDYRDLRHVRSDGLVMTRRGDIVEPPGYTGSPPEELTRTPTTPSGVVVGSDNKHRSTHKGAGLDGQDLNIVVDRPVGLKSGLKSPKKKSERGGIRFGDTNKVRLVDESNPDALTQLVNPESGVLTEETRDMDLNLWEQSMDIGDKKGRLQGELLGKLSDAGLTREGFLRSEAESKADYDELAMGGNQSVVASQLDSRVTHNPDGIADSVANKESRGMEDAVKWTDDSLHDEYLASKKKGGFSAVLKKDVELGRSDPQNRNSKNAKVDDDVKARRAEALNQAELNQGQNASPGVREQRKLQRVEDVQYVNRLERQGKSAEAQELRDKIDQNAKAFEEEQIAKGIKEAKQEKEFEQQVSEEWGVDSSEINEAISSSPPDAALEDGVDIDLTDVDVLGSEKQNKQDVKSGYARAEQNFVRQYSEPSSHGMTKADDTLRAAYATGSKVSTGRRDLESASPMNITQRTTTRVQQNAAEPLSDWIGGNHYPQKLSHFKSPDLASPSKRSFLDRVKAKINRSPAPSGAASSDLTDSTRPMTEGSSGLRSAVSGVDPDVMRNLGMPTVPPASYAAVDDTVRKSQSSAILDNSFENIEFAPVAGIADDDISAYASIPAHGSSAEKSTATIAEPDMKEEQIYAEPFTILDPDNASSRQKLAIKKALDELEEHFVKKGAVSFGRDGDVGALRERLGRCLQDARSFLEESNKVPVKDAVVLCARLSEMSAALEKVEKLILPQYSPKGVTPRDASPRRDNTPPLSDTHIQEPLPSVENVKNIRTARDLVHLLNDDLKKLASPENDRSIVKMNTRGSMNGELMNSEVRDIINGFGKEELRGVLNRVVKEDGLIGFVNEMMEQKQHAQVAAATVEFDPHGPGVEPEKRIDQQQKDSLVKLIGKATAEITQSLSVLYQDKPDVSRYYTTRGAVSHQHDAARSAVGNRKHEVRDGLTNKIDKVTDFVRHPKHNITYRDAIAICANLGEIQRVSKEFLALPQNQGAEAKKMWQDLKSYGNTVRGYQHDTDIPALTENIDVYLERMKSNDSIDSVMDAISKGDESQLQAVMTQTRLYSPPQQSSDQMKTSEQRQQSSKICLPPDEPQSQKGGFGSAFKGLFSSTDTAKGQQHPPIGGAAATTRDKGVA